MTETLHNRDDSQNDDDGEPNHVPIAHLVAVADREVAKAAGANGACHGGDTDQADERDHRHARDAGDAFLQIYAENNFQRREAHGSAGFHQPIIHFRQHGFDLPGKEWNRSRDQRHIRTRNAGSRSLKSFYRLLQRRLPRPPAISEDFLRSFRPVFCFIPDRTPRTNSEIEKRMLIALYRLYSQV